jgi:hypothetical protein
MPVNITDSPTFTDPVTAPDDGDDANGATFQASPQALSNRTRYLKNRVDALYGNSAVALEGALALNDFNVSIEHDLTVGGNLGVTGNVTVTGDISCDDFTAADVITAGTTMNCQRLSASIDVFATRFRFFASTLSDADGSLTVGSTAQLLAATTMTDNRVYTISDTGAVNGDFFWVVNQSGGAFTVTVKNPGGTNLGVLSDLQGGLFARVGGSWLQITTAT